MKNGLSNMIKILDYIKRNAAWLLPGLLALALLWPAMAEIRTLLLIILIECLAVALSGLAVYAYTRIDFTRDHARQNLGFVFLGVHICVGMIVLGVYLVQFAE